MNVPKLRFPEFRDSGEWDVKLLILGYDQLGGAINADNFRMFLSLG